MWLTKFRLRMFIRHLLVSLILACISIYFVYFIWHPAPLAKAIGVNQIFSMMLIIDCILGPLLTLIVAKENKKSFKKDLWFICIIQLSAFMYGMHSIIVSRPTNIVFDTVRFDLVQKNDIASIFLNDAKEPYNKIDWFGVKWSAVKIANTKKEKENRIFLEVEQGVSPSMQPNLYESLNNQKQLIQSTTINLEKLKLFNDKNIVQEILDKYPKAKGWIPLKASAVDMVILLDKDANVVKIVDLRPWK